MSRWLQKTFDLNTDGRGFYRLDGLLQPWVAGSGINTGLCHCFIRHTSASLLITENADPAVRRDLERFFSRLVPDGDPMFEHADEGPDDMPSHVRSVLTCTDLSITLCDGRLALGTWQGVYLWEHRARAHHRSVLVTLNGQ